MSQTTPNLYTVVTEFGGDFTETIVWTGSIDLTTGSINKLVENFIYVGGSATYDGISDYDEANGFYYFSNDVSTPFIYSSDVRKQVIRPTISTGAQTVLRIHHDSTNNRLLSVQQQNTGTGYVVQVPTTTDGGKASVLTALPSNVNYDAILVSAFDDQSQMFYLLAGNMTNPNGPYYLSTSLFSNPQPTYQSVLLAGACPSGIAVKTFPQYIAYDSVRKQVIAGVEKFINQDIQYSIYIIQPNGACAARQIPLPVFGIITAWAYDSTTRLMYFALAPNGSPLIYAVNVDTMVLTQSIVVPFVPSSLEVSYK